MLKRFSNWLADYEPLFRLCYRLLLLAALGYGLLRMEVISADLADVADQLDALVEAVAELQDGADEETAMGAGLAPHPTAVTPQGSGHDPIRRHRL